MSFEKKETIGQGPLDKLDHFPTGSTNFLNDPSHAKPGIHPYPDRLHVLTVLHNPLRWRSRYLNFNSFRHQMEQSGAILYVCEIAHGGRAFEVTDPNNPRHLQLRTMSEVWHKERALKLLLEKCVPADAKKIAWIDADIKFAREDWAQETLHLLDHYRVLQMFSQVANLGPDHGKITERGSFMWNYLENRLPPHHPDFSKFEWQGSASYYGAKAGKWQHTGFAWAARKQVISDIGGFIDWAILGSGDYHQATAFIEEVQKSLNPDFPKRYVEKCYEYQQRCHEYVKKNVGYMPGLILHDFHGTTKNRSYNTRWKLLSRTSFNPDVDLIPDHQGLWRLTERSIELRDGLMAFNRMRREDSDSIEGML